MSDSVEMNGQSNVATSRKMATLEGVPFARFAKSLVCPLSVVRKPPLSVATATLSNLVFSPDETVVKVETGYRIFKLIIIKVTKFSLLILAVAFTGCNSNIRDSSPSLLKDGVQLQQRKVVVDTEHAKIIMKSTGFPHPVQFSVRRSSDADQRAEVLGTVVDSGRGKVFGWIAKMNEVANSATVKRFPQLEVQADPGQEIEVIGESKVYDSNYYRYAEKIVYACGPMSSTFKPKKQKVYLVEFVIVGAGCEQHVYDISEPTKRLPIVIEE